MLATGTLWKRSLLRTALSSIVILAIGCSDDEEPALNGWPAYDASAVTTPEAGSVTPDAGAIVDSSAPKPDGGTVVPVMDSSVTPTPDTGVVATPDASGDGTVDIDGWVDDGAVADGAVDDSAVGDGAVEDGAAGDAGDSAVADAGPRPDLGKGQAKEVVTIGDSWMDNTIVIPLIADTGGGIGQALRRASKQNYPNYALQGVMLLEADTFGPAIPTQWDAAIKANPGIKTVVMTGGGNDIIQGSSALQTSCKNGTDLCQQTLTKIGKTLADLWVKMSKAGVQDIVYILYATAANTGRLKDPANNNAAIKLLCDAVPAPARCHVFNTDALVPSTSNLVDGIHPNAATNTKIGAALYEFMTKEGMRR